MKLFLNWYKSDMAVSACVRMCYGCLCLRVCALCQLCTTCLVETSMASPFASKWAPSKVPAANLHPPHRRSLLWHNPLPVPLLWPCGPHQHRQHSHLYPHNSALQWYMS